MHVKVNDYHQHREDIRALKSFGYKHKGILAGTKKRPKSKSIHSRRKKGKR